MTYILTYDTVIDLLTGVFVCSSSNSCSNNNNNNNNNLVRCRYEEEVLR